ncbi:MAG: hypothetical protein IJA26_06880 [Clostridia bacterium]|nr:hypothetical protein [Clostridia bacterium]
MQKNLFRYPWLWLAVTAGIIAGAALMLRALFPAVFHAREVYSGAYFVKEALRYALL